MHTLLLSAGLIACPPKTTPNSESGQPPRDSADADTDTDTDADSDADSDTDTDTDTDTNAGAVVLWEVDPASACPGSYVSSAPVQGHNTGFSAGGQTRSFTLMLPSDSGPRPMLLALHGTSTDGAEFVDYTEIDQDFVDAGFVVVAPDGNENGEFWPVWDALRLPTSEGDSNPDLEFFDDVMACVAAHHAVDQNRLYVAGHSAGGIMTNRVLRERSSVFAGGIVASGVFDLTSANDSLDPLLAIVTWGGDNDIYSGSTSNGTTVPAISFVEQSALASQFYDSHAAQVQCEGNNLGHAWLDDLNAWFIEVLLANPKGTLGSGAPAVSIAPTSAPADCSTDAAQIPEGATVVCPSAINVPNCRTFCQAMGDCVVENLTLSLILGPQVEMLGFEGSDLSECGGCVEVCEATASSSADDEVLACFAAADPSAECSTGIEGGMPLFEAVNSCCAGRTDSALCSGMCGVLETSDVAGAFFPSCSAF